MTLLNYSHKFPPEVVCLLEGISGLALRSEVQVFLVGGLVRDLCLADINSSSLLSGLDIDLMVHPKHDQLLALLQREGLPECLLDPDELKISAFKEFLTAKVFLPSHVLIGIEVLDFSSARKESYSEPAAKPQVSYGKLEEDLARRDFSVNAMALSLEKDGAGVLIDPFKGFEACQRKELQVLHDQSFIDDPARLIRGIRFACRFGFGWCSRTAGLVDEAIAQNYISLLSAGRLASEFRKALKEPKHFHLMLKLLFEMEIAQKLSSKLEFSDQIFRELELAEQVASKEGLPKDFDLSQLRFAIIWKLSSAHLRDESSSSWPWLKEKTNYCSRLSGLFSKKERAGIDLAGQFWRSKN